MEKLSLTIPIEPHGWERVSARILRRKNGGQQFVHFYEEAATRRYKKEVTAAALKAMGAAQPFDGPLTVTMDFIMPVPKSWSDVKWQRAVSGLVRPGSRPDVDNLMKAVADACNGVIWVDDAQIVDCRLRKVYGRVPSIHMTVRETAIGLLEIDDAA